MVFNGAQPDIKACPLADFRLPKSFAKHPGGQHHLDQARESDCAGELFLSYHLTSDMNKVAAAANALGIQMPMRGPLFDDIYEACSRVMSEHPEQHYIFQAWCLLLTIAMPCISIWWLTYPTFVSSFCTAFVFEMYFFNVFHTRHHKGGKLYKNDLLNSIFDQYYYCIDHVWGYRPQAWRKNHHILHHVYTNEADHDPDMPGSYPVIRTCKSQRLRWFHRFQTFYFPLPLPLVVLSLPPWNALVNGGTILALALWAAIMFVLPFALNGSHGIYYSVLLQAIAGLSLSYKFAISHVHSDLGTVDGARHANIDAWMKAQMEEAQSWGGYLSTLLFGGINFQVEHHICPAMDPLYYVYLWPELQRICSKHGIRYTYEPTIGHAIWAFHRQLWVMGCPQPQQ